MTDAPAAHGHPNPRAHPGLRASAVVDAARGVLAVNVLIVRVPARDLPKRRA